MRCGEVPERDQLARKGLPACVGHVSEHPVQADYLVDSLLLPSKAIKENFDVTRVVTKEDRVISGIKVRPDRTVNDAVAEFSVAKARDI